MQSTIFNFNTKSNVSNWKIIDDVVMGGRSAGRFYLNENGTGVFEGVVSLENNGGFSSVKYCFNHISTEAYSNVFLKVKGDGKIYQFRIRAKSSDYYSYITTFQTNTEWQTLPIPLNTMSPYFRGRKVDLPNYNQKGIEEIAFLIGNKKAENFKLIIDSILLE